MTLWLSYEFKSVSGSGLSLCRMKHSRGHVTRNFLPPSHEYLHTSCFSLYHHHLILSYRGRTFPSLAKDDICILVLCVFSHICGLVVKSHVPKGEKSFRWLDDCNESEHELVNDRRLWAAVSLKTLKTVLGCSCLSSELAALGGAFFLRMANACSIQSSMWKITWAGWFKFLTFLHSFFS